MNKLKLGVLALAVCGLVASFLPFRAATVGSEPVSFYKLVNAFRQGHQFYLTVGGYILALLMALIAIVRPPMQQWQGIASIVGFAWVIMKLREHFVQHITEDPIGAKLMVISAIIGVVVALFCAAKPEAAK